MKSWIAAIRGSPLRGVAKFALTPIRASASARASCETSNRLDTIVSSSYKQFTHHKIRSEQ